jgi:hypothetical protein
MTNERKPGSEAFLSRWSRRKLDAARTETAPRAVAVETASSAPPAPVVAAPAPSGPPALQAEPLPAVESLTFDSDFRAFLRPGVDQDVQRAALRKLLRDPRFNVMDGLDVYIDDYTKPSPLDPSIIKDLVQARYILSPPATRVNAQGYVEDVPDEPVAVPARTDAGDGSDGTVVALEGDSTCVPSPDGATDTPSAPRAAEPSRHSNDD